jgi:2-polyprenyl-6-hydroxyphenyl methylase/3-demethylubiquinone-9 3-methyltransferase
MSIGAKVRRLFGPLEGPVTDLYRSFFIDLSRMTRVIRRWAPDAATILEIGCGEGALSERLSRAYPAAQITGIDITPRVGRLFRGDSDRVRFVQATAGAYADTHPMEFDLVLLCDVLHHVPTSERELLLRDAGRLVRPGGALVVKDWERFPNLGHVLAEFSDRVLTGDDVSYGSAGEFRQLLEESFGPQSVYDQTRLPPWRNNLAFLVRLSTHCC